MHRTNSHEDLISSSKSRRKEQERIELARTELNNLIEDLSNFFLTKAPKATFGYMISSDLKTRVFNRKLNANREMTDKAVKSYLEEIYKDKFSNFTKEEIKLLDVLINFYLVIHKTLNKLEEMKASRIYSGLSDAELNQEMQLVMKNLPTFRIKKDPWADLRKLLVWEKSILTDLKTISDERENNKMVVVIKPKKEDEETKQRKQRKRDDTEYIYKIINDVNALPPRPSEFEVSHPGTSGRLPNLVNTSIETLEKARGESVESTQSPRSNLRESRTEDITPPPAPPRRSLAKYIGGIFAIGLLGAVAGGGVGTVAGLAGLGVGLIVTVPAGIAAGFLIGIIAGSLSVGFASCTKENTEEPTREQRVVERSDREYDDERRPTPVAQAKMRRPSTDARPIPREKQEEKAKLSTSQDAFVRAPGSYPPHSSSLPIVKQEVEYVTRGRAYT